jgi:hypothetical protein
MDTVTPDDVRKDVLGDEKRIEDVEKSSSDAELEAARVEIDETEAKRILAKVDYRLVPILALLYLVAFIDRSNSELGRAQDFLSSLTWDSRKCQNRRAHDRPRHARSPIQYGRHLVLRSVYAARGSE